MIHESDRVVITGCGGMLGEAVYLEFKDSCNVYASDIDVNEPWLARLDVSIQADVERYLNDVKPNYIVHLAALTDMEYCELNPEHAYATNTKGVENVARYASAHNIPLLYISTAGIFDGEQDEYIESDTPNPLSVYGKSKYGGELVARGLDKSVVIRAGWMMGGGPKKDKKFINKIIRQIKSGSKELAVVNDKFGTPCYTYDLAKSIKFLLDNEMYGIYHGACEGSVNRYEVAQVLVKNLGVEQKVSIREVDSSFFNEVWFAPRPRSEKLLNVRLKEVGPHLTRDWKECIDEYMKKFDWNLWDMNTSGMNRSFYKNYFKIEKEHWLMRVRRDIVRDTLVKNKRGSKLLDFGCGSGLFVGELANEGYDSYGLDISLEAINFGRIKKIQNLDVIDFHKINFPDNTFDNILALDVLEHLEDEEWALKEIERALKPGGTAVIMLPAYKFLWGIHDEAAHHYRRYTRSKFLNKIKSSTEMEVVRSTYFNTFLFTPIFLVRMVSRIFNIKNRESDYEINNPFLNKLFFSIFNLERKMLRHINFPFGVSIMIVLRKSN